MNHALPAIALITVFLLAGCAGREDAPRHHPHPRDQNGVVARPAGDARPTRAPGRESGLLALPRPPGAFEGTPEAEGLQTFTEEEDYDGDGIADTRTIRRFKYDAAGRTCRLVTERDFDADGTIDARTTNTSSYGAVGACGT